MKVLQSRFTKALWKYPRTREKRDADFPFLLTTGRRLESYNTGVQSTGYGSPLHAGETLDISPEDASRLDISTGDLVRVTSRRGSVVAPAFEVVHGKTSRVNHQGGVLFDGIPSPFPAGRYHSLAATVLPEQLLAIAGTERIVMAVAHCSAPQFGVQFHPESILTPEGGRIIDNVMRWASDAPQ